MASYVAFLRAINVGGRVVKMDVLKKSFVRLGFKDVDTFIASGNVLFSSSVKDTARLEKQIEVQLKKDLGYEVSTFIRTAEEVLEVAACKSFTAAQIAAARVHYVGFLSEPLSESGRTAIQGLSCDLESFYSRGREWFWLTRAGVGESTVSNATIEKALKVRSTVRGMNTIVRLAGRITLKAGTPPMKGREQVERATRARAQRREPGGVQGTPPVKKR